MTTEKQEGQTFGFRRTERGGRPIKGFITAPKLTVWDILRALTRWHR